MRMNRLLLALAGAALLALVFWKATRPAPAPKAPPPRVAIEPPPARASQPPRAALPPPIVRVPDGKPALDLDTLLAALAKALRDGDADEAKRLLAELAKAVKPATPPDEKNAALLYKKAFDLLAAVKLDEKETALFMRDFDRNPLAPDEVEALRALVDKHKEAFSLLRKAAAMPDCVFPINYEDGMAALLPHVAPTILATKYLRLESALCRMDGDTAGASGSTLAALALSRGIRNDSILISQLVGVVTQGIAAQDLMRAFDRDSPDAIALAAGLDPSSAREGLVRSLYTEITAAVGLFLHGDTSQMLGDDERRVFENPLRLQDAAFYVDTMSKLIELSGRPYGEARAELEILERGYETAPWYAYGTKLVLPALGRASRNIAQSESFFAKAKLAAALKNYRFQAGAYPASLEILGIPPRDPLTGEPFLYRREGAGFVLETPGQPDFTWKSEK